MKVRLVLLIAVAISGLLLAPAAAAPRDDAGCDDLDAYVLDVMTAIPEDDLEELFALMEEPIESMRPSDAEQASELLDDWATALDDFRPSQVPDAAKPYHEAFVDSLSLFSSVYNTLATSGPFGILVYADAVEEATIEIEDAQRYGARECGADWPFDDDATEV